jgi:hypothetical protein
MALRWKEPGMPFGPTGAIYRRWPRRTRSRVRNAKRRALVGERATFNSTNMVMTIDILVRGGVYLRRRNARLEELT